MFEKLQQRVGSAAARNSRQRQIERALYKAGGGGLADAASDAGNAYVPDARQAERTAESVGSTSTTTAA